MPYIAHSPGLGEDAGIIAEVDREISAAYERWELLESIPKGRE